MTLVNSEAAVTYSLCKIFVLSPVETSYYKAAMALCIDW